MIKFVNKLKFSKFGLCSNAEMILGCGQGSTDPNCGQIFETGFDDEGKLMFISCVTIVINTKSQKCLSIPIYLLTA